MKLLEAKSRYVLFARIYFIFLFGWAILHAIIGDRWSVLFLISSFAQYLFAPLPIIFAIALAGRRGEIWIGFAASITLVANLYGGLLTPKFLANPSVATLTVMTYNMLYLSENQQSIITSIRTSTADVVAIQELTPLAADAIERELKAAYPYQVLDRQNGISGMGTISRYPLYDAGETVPGEWSNAPQILVLDWNGTPVTVMNLHAISPNFLPSKMAETIRERERQAQTIATIAKRNSTPFVALGDFNAGDQSTAYGIVTQELTDSWREAGWGLGHTFPGIIVDSLPRAIHDGLSVAGWETPTPANPNTGITVPLWLVRLDYIFHSHHWQAANVQIGQWDGMSDHRPVIAKLFLMQR
jgi:endonuclease/exonuclease/phosphatase (EEP) superfamily protein YafD